MMESIFSFLPSYLLSIIFLAKGKISKSISLFLSHIGPKRCWPIRLEDFKSNISLEQSDEIVYFLTWWYQKLRVDRKILWWLWSEALVTTLDEWIELIFCMVIHGVRKVISSLGMYMVKYGYDLLGLGTLKSACKNNIECWLRLPG